MVEQRQVGQQPRGHGEGERHVVLTEDRSILVPLGLVLSADRDCGRQGDRIESETPLGIDAIDLAHRAVQRGSGEHAPQGVRQAGVGAVFPRLGARGLREQFRSGLFRDQSGQLVPQRGVVRLPCARERGGVRGFRLGNAAAGETSRHDSADQPPGRPGPVDCHLAPPRNDGRATATHANLLGGKGKRAVVRTTPDGDRRAGRGARARFRATGLLACRRVSAGRQGLQADQFRQSRGGQLFPRHVAPGLHPTVDLLV